ncbi:hypothetical protein GCM10007880_66970 [Mesorhizobium amorphae]|uniref:calcium-binding protein n=1 Tax=Mesorhizobium amorphae TaxID=71433 RepID=UPI00235BDB9F|nr:hemolysin-type calcium-binding protein [Mesorhizobium amorphae]GLR46179.1 hypothetical protein GCM10007880_66970 [Mesorhizobium amorphae]
MAIIRGTESDDRLVGTPERDYIRGLGGSDIINGAEGADNLEGNQGNDTLFGNAGDDILFGDEGDDALYGNEGNDSFIFNSGGGRDSLGDFAVGQDKLYVAEGINGTSIHTITDLANRVEEAGPDSTIVDLGKGSTITLTNVSANDVQHHPEKYFSILHNADLHI